MKKHYWYSRSRSSSMPREQAAAAAAPPPQLQEGTRPGAAADANPGCMAMVHYLIFAPGAGCVGRPPSQVVDFHDVVNSSSHNKGLEAPRNSLELDGDQLKDIQIGVQIEPAFDALAGSAMRPKATAPSSEAETPRTPSLVARLMGIDGLPEPRASSSSTDKAEKEDQSTTVKEKKKRVIPESMNRELRQPLRSLSCNVPASPGEARSLPDTPRTSTSSSARAPSPWDVVDHPRMSLQVLKENVLDRAAQYMSLPTSPTSCGAKKKSHRRREAAKEHAREIVRQAKETVSNRKSSGSKKSTSSNKENASPLVLGEAKPVVVQGATAGKPTAPPPKGVQADQQPHAPRLPLAPMPPPPQRAKPSRPPPPPPPLDPPPRAVPPQGVKCKRPDGCERFATRIKKTATTTSQQAQPAPPPAAAPPLSSRKNDGMTSASRPAVPLEEDPEYSYLRTVLDRGGFMRTTPSRPLEGHSVAAPMDPIIFHLLELELPADEARLGPLRHRWNRKLLFQLAQEILADLLLGIDAASSGTAASGGPALLGKVWWRVRSFPAADCKVVGDIEALVGRDLEAASVRRLVRHPAVVEEAGDVAEEVAELVLDALLGESLSLSSCGWSSRASCRVTSPDPNGNSSHARPLPLPLPLPLRSAQRGHDGDTNRMAVRARYQPP